MGTYIELGSPPHAQIQVRLTVNDFLEPKEVAGRILRAMHVPVADVDFALRHMAEHNQGIPRLTSPHEP